MTEIIAGRHGRWTRFRQDERGSLLLAMMIMMTLSAIVIAASVVMLTEVEIAGNFANNNASFVVADSGLMHMMAVLEKEYDPVKDKDEMLTPFLLGKDKKPNTADDGYYFGYEGAKKEKPAGPEPVELGKGTYYIQIIDNDDGDGDPLVDVDEIVVVISTSWWAGSNSRVRATVGMDIQKYTHTGLISNGKLRTTGSTKMIGPYTRIHSNGDVDLANDQMDGGATSTGKLKIGGGTVEGQTFSRAEMKAYEDSHSGVPPVEIPDIKADDYEDGYDYKLQGDCKVKNADGDTIAEGEWGEWNCKNDTWEIKDAKAGDTGTTGKIFVDGDIKWGNGNGEEDAPLEMTLVVKGDLKGSGGDSWLKHAADAEEPKLALVVEGSIKWSGNKNFEGNVYVGGSVDSSGGWDMLGTLVMSDDDLDGSRFSNHLTIESPASSRVGFETSPGMGVVSWRVDPPNTYTY